MTTEQNFKPRVPEGRYIARAKSREFGETPESRTQYVRVHFEIESGEAAGIGIAWDGWLTEGAIEMTLEALAACGWDGVSLSETKGLGTKRCELVVEHQTNERTGRLFAQVAWVNRPGSMPIEDRQKLAKSQIEQLDGKFAGVMGAFRDRGMVRERKPRSQAVPPRTFAPSDAHMPADDDDIPF